MKSWFVAGLVVVCGVAHADPPKPRVAVSIDTSATACVGDLALVRRLISLELGSEIVTDERDVATRVDVRCDAGLTTIHVDDAITRKTTERTLDLTAQDAAVRPRLLALTIVETIASSWVELEMAKAVDVHPVREARTTEAVRSGAAAIARSRLVAPARSAGSIGLAGLGRVFTPGSLVTLGARLDGQWALSSRVALALDLAAEAGSVSKDVGTIRVALLSITPGLRVRPFDTSIELMAGLGFRLGLAQVRGDSSASDFESSELVAPWGGPVASIEARAPLTQHTGITFGIEGGVVTMSVRGEVDHMPGADVAGGWGAAWVAFTYLP